jgi:rSAM/selenodomain-associated transferase 2
MDSPRISVIVPALDEEAGLAPVLAACRVPGVEEIILVDGGSSDGTRELAARSGASVLSSERGRGRQLNRGAAAAKGEIFLFLHADTLLPAGFAEAIPRLLRRPGTSGGAFRLRIEGEGVALRLIEAGVHLRSILLGLPYGDQALFLTRDDFFRVGGFPDVPILEDMIMVLRLRRMGKVRIAGDAVRTSSRRWRETGPWRMTCLNQAAVWAYFAGFPPERIAEWYHSRSPGR